MAPAAAAVARAVNEASVRALARALCDSSSHANLLPPEEQRPCEYHLKRARDTVALLSNRRLIFALHPPAEETTKLIARMDAAAELSRLEAENLRQRVQPIRVGS